MKVLQLVLDWSLGALCDNKVKVAAAMSHQNFLRTQNGHWQDHCIMKTDTEIKVIFVILVL